MVYLFLTTGFETVEALTAVDLLRRANIELTTVSITGSIEVTSSLNVTVKADQLYGDIDFSDAEALILPGGPGTPSYMECQALCELLVKHHQEGKLVAAICAAPTILAKNGILVKSTVYPAMKDEIADYVQQKVCVEGNVITGEALGASVDFALEIIKYLLDEEAANKVALGIVK